MKHALFIITLLLSSTVSLTGCGKIAASASAPAKTSAPGTDLAALKKSLQDIYDDRVVTDLRPAPMPGLYEFVLDNSEVFYTDVTAHYILGGWLFDTEKGVNLTKVQESSLFAAKVSKLNYDHAIKHVNGNGSRKLVVFSDPFCPSCRDLEPNLQQLKDVTIYTFLYPFIEENHDPKHKVSRKVWCDADRAAAWHNWMLKEEQPKNAGNCEFPLKALMEAGKKMGLTGVPSIIFADGSMESGALSTEDLEAGLAQGENAGSLVTAAAK
jgi:thiol:disulfide interchange protein DsbC